jgi:prophage regulatory protein
MEHAMTNSKPDLLRQRQVTQRTGLPRSSLYAQIAKGNFPAPVAISANAVAWPSNAIDKWIAARIAGGK